MYFIVVRDVWEEKEWYKWFVNNYFNFEYIPCDKCSSKRYLQDRLCDMVEKNMA